MYPSSSNILSYPIGISDTTEIFCFIYIHKDADMKVANICCGEIHLNLFAMQTMLRL